MGSRLVTLVLGLVGLVLVQGLPEQRGPKLRGLRVAIGPDVAKERCREVVANIKAHTSLAVFSLAHSLGGRVGAGVPKVEVRVPASWTEQDCGESLQEVPANQAYDVLVTSRQSGKAWTVQSQGCSHPGSHIVLPLDSIFDPATHQTGPESGQKIVDDAASGSHLASQLLRLRYGVFAGLDAPNHVTGEHYTHCQGRTVSQVVLSHPDFRGSGAISGNFSAPVFTVTRVGAPRYMLLLENSRQMNSRGQWDFLRTASRDLVMRGLPPTAHLGVVLFNEAAHVAHPLALLGEAGKSRTRQSVALQIKSKHALSPSEGSCVQCAVARAVESLGEGGVLILISRADNISVDLLPLLIKHRLQLFSIALPETSETAGGSKILERLAHASGGSATLVVPNTSQDDDSPPISFFVALQDAFRNVLQRTVPLSPFLIHESDYLSFEEGRDRKVGHFVVDRFARRETQFRVYFRDQLESYIRALTVDSEVGSSYSTIMDSSTSSHYLGVYDVPYDAPGNAGLAWRYSLDRLPSPRRMNSHIVQVTSQAPSDQEELEVKVKTNLVGHKVDVNLEQPLILFVEVRQAGQAVSGARVLCDLLLAEGEAGRAGTTFTLELWDNGAGDPDMVAGDGVYSKYMSRLAGPGLYRLRVQVLSNQDFPAMVKTRDSFEGTSLGPFTRIVKGNSFRVSSIAPHYRARIPPSRILDLSVSVVSSSQQLEFEWSAPGSDYDEGRPTSYLLYQSTDPELYTGTALPPSLLVESFSGVRGAGGREAHRVTVSQGDVNKNLYYVLLAADSEGNIGQMGNIVKAYMPRPLLVGHSRDNSPLREGLFDPMRTPNEPNIIVMYIIAGIAAIIIFTFLVIVIVICLLKKKTRFGSEMSNEQLNTDSMSKRGSLYNGFSIDEFDTEKINQLNYYNSLRQVKPPVEATDGSEGSIQRNLEYCMPDLAEYRESDAASSSPPSSRRADPTYARPVPKAQRAKSAKAASGSPLTISERTASSPAESDTYEYITDLAREPATSAEPIYRSILKKVPPPTLPKSVAGLDVTVTPRPPDLVTVLDLVPPSPSSNSLPDTESQMSPTDKRVRSCTQV